MWRPVQPKNESANELLLTTIKKHVAYFYSTKKETPNPGWENPVSSQGLKNGVDEGSRTLGLLNHNQAL